MLAKNNHFADLEKILKKTDEKRRKKVENSVMKGIKRYFDSCEYSGIIFDVSKSLLPEKVRVATSKAAEKNLENSG